MVQKIVMYSTIEISNGFKKSKVVRDIFFSAKRLWVEKENLDLLLREILKEKDIKKIKEKIKKIILEGVILEDERQY
jgi:hypothetical protein